MDELDKKVYDVFSGRVVKKGATKLVKGASNVPTYVLEYLLGTYCTSDDDKEIEDGIAQVKKILADNYVRNDEVELIKSRIRDFGSYNGNYSENVKLLQNEKICICSRMDTLQQSSRLVCKLLFAYRRLARSGRVELERIAVDKRDACIFLRCNGKG